MIREKRIPITWAMRWRRFRLTTLPVLTFFVSLGLAVLLWKQQGQTPNTVGRVEAVRVNMAAGVDGRLLPIAELEGGKWTVLDSVREGDVVARLDDAPLRALLDALRGDMAAFQSQLEEKRVETTMEHYDRQHEYMREAAELACAVEKMRLEAVDRAALIEADRIELQKLEIQITLQKNAKAKGVLTAWEIQEAQMNRDLVAKRLESNAKVLRTAEENLRLSVARQERQPMMPGMDLEKLLGPIRASIAAAEARVREVQLQIDNLEVRAPISGTISAVYFQPGQPVRAQEWILTIASDQARHIIGYVRPKQRLQPVAGSKAGIRPRLPAARMVDSVVEHVGVQWEALPLELALDPQVTELVLPIRVKMPEGLQLRPGEVVDLTFHDTRETSVK